VPGNFASFDELVLDDLHNPQGDRLSLSKNPRMLYMAASYSFPSPFPARSSPGTFEYTLSHLIDHELELSVFAARSRNDEVGAPAYDQAILLKIILYAYSRGITSSR
jgi:hypothetical protein